MCGTVDPYRPHVRSVCLISPVVLQTSRSSENTTVAMPHLTSSNPSYCWSSGFTIFCLADLSRLAGLLIMSGLISSNRAGEGAGDRDWGYSVPRGRSRYRQAAAAVAAAVATGAFFAFWISALYIHPPSTLPFDGKCSQPGAVFRGAVAHEHAPPRHVKQ